MYNTVGIEDLENEIIYLHKYTRTIAIQIACSTGSKACRSEAVNKLIHNLDNKQEFHQNIRSFMYCESIRGAKRSEFNRVWMKLADFNNNDITYRNILLSGLSCIDDKKLLNEYLNSALNSTNDKLIVYQSVAEQQQIIRNVYQNSLMGHDMTIEYLIKNIDEAFNTFGSDGLNSILSSISYSVCSNFARSAVRFFFTLKMFFCLFLSVFNLLQFEKLTKLCGEKNYASQTNLDYYNDMVNRNFQWNDQYLKGINDWLIHNV